MTPNSKELSDAEQVNNGNIGSRIHIVSDYDKIKILVDPMRRKILRTMREGLENEDGTIRKEMTVPEIARKLGVSAPKCYHHLDKLVENGFVRVAREDQKKRTSTTYYERTSPAFLGVVSIDEIERKEGLRENPLIALINNGFLLELSEKDQDTTQKLMDELTSRQHGLSVELAKKLKGNIPEDRVAVVINYFSRQVASQDKRCQEIRQELSKYIKIDL